MSKHSIALPAALTLATALAAGALAQQGRGPNSGDSGKTQAPATKEADAADLVKRMMAFDKNADGKLTKEEISDDRLLNLFARADADKDGQVTKEELTKLGEAEHSSRPGFGDGPPPGGRRGPRPPGGGPPPPAPPR